MESHDVVQNSFDRCLATGDFFQTFYDIFLATSPEITSKFAQTDVRDDPHFQNLLLRMNLER